MNRHFDFDKPHKRGDELSHAQRQAVKASYVHRFTKDHVPAWTAKPWKNGKPYPVQFASDVDWLVNTLFQVRKDGTLADADCYSTPTWPDNPELRKA